MRKIAIIERYEPREQPNIYEGIYYICKEFKDMADEAGFMLIPAVSSEHAAETAEMCDGLILSGSRPDTFPKYYGEEPLEGKTYDIDEFPFVKKHVDAFRALGKPILGVCAGCQEISVAFGGTLFQRIEGHHLDDLSCHEVCIAPDSFIYEVFGSERAMVNSFHRQAVKDVPDGFRVTAMAQDGTIEAIENGNVVGVQWHPEAMRDAHFFKTFVKRFIPSED